MPLLEDIRTHILDHNIPLASILREVMVLARKLRSDEILKWVNAELEGYKDGAELPDYRQFPALSIGTGANPRWLVKDAPIPTYILPAEIRQHLEEGTIAGGVRELGSLLESTEPFFRMPWPPEIISLYNRIEGVNVELIEAYVTMPRGLIERVLDTVRTRLLRFVVEIEELNPSAGEIPSLEKVPPATANRIFEKFIMNENNYGDVHKIEKVYGSNVASGEARIILYAARI